MCGDEAWAAAAAAVRTRRGAGADAKGVVPLLRPVAACVRPLVPEEGRPALGGWSIRLVTWQPQRDRRL
ncbi:Hypothetical predicted protein [Marmota monax]|uniref:Uncharacterized protein n=1 Tax=Marmota monax TaxID=9995 RepID=A0A5E4ALI2_MARMO|nr:hypothetical protein GHT09_019331 [Marmota monax]VTJ58174.1 Hypothetical predicted protein [Marmota monax]